MEVSPMYDNIATRPATHQRRLGSIAAAVVAEQTSFTGPYSSTEQQQAVVLSSQQRHRHRRRGRIFPFSVTPLPPTRSPLLPHCHLTVAAAAAADVTTRSCAAHSPPSASPKPQPPLGASASRA